jgi:cellulose synthase (UDP-forming)
MQILHGRENPLWKRGLSLAQRVSYFTSMTTYFQSLQIAVFVSMPALILATGESPIRNYGPSFFARFVPYVASVVVATKLTGGSSQRIAWDFYFAFLRMFTFLRALPPLVTGGRRLRFRVTPKAPSGPAHRRGLYPHLAAAVLNLAVIAALVAEPLRHGFDTGTTIAVCASAAIIAAFYALTLVRLWRRVYRRHHYRVPVALGDWVAVDRRL